MATWETLTTIFLPLCRPL